MRAECPRFRLVANAGWIGIWEGPLRPICQTYLVRIVYFPWGYFRSWRIANPHISVFVIDPPIGPDPRGTGEPPQHVYRLGYPPEFPRLCIHDPVEDALLPDEYIVERIVPWTIKWLFFHEEWVASGEWKGGGRHPELPEPCLREDDLNPESRAQREQFRNAAFHRLGRKLGVFGSYRSMEVVSVESSPLPSWQDLSDAIQAAPPLPPTLISLPAPQLVAFLPWAWAPDTPPANSSTSTLPEDARSFRPSPTLRSAA